MSGDYKSVPDGLILVSTIIAWDYAIDWLSYRSKIVSRLLRSPPLCLVKDGRMLRKNMKKEWITESELMEKIRQGGVQELCLVKAAYLEDDGEISVIKV